ncbi:peptidoglycan DD-metalloendopeptidase family protein [Microbulbifer sp. CAU 1566]|uniref:peptidoglycan DD-metalloendopeptidase family protein n=1 Tax=Microbulbifer sp. CAU 1566 TaxID=2933269 RepID=UPI00200540C7|nr:peptidoglycan DD-metalloendopeptidase family protein [Microbulbifer sp. CAU 1566]MCK7597624.1 peptidoglycan DD-metalloendopeptidase family protein [Microbulbifer sp. CAU 1566]
MKRRINRHSGGSKSESWPRNVRHLSLLARKVFVILTLSVGVVSCASNLAPTSSLNQPPSQRIQHHTVSKGETLYSIAWRYSKDFKDLAAINRIPSPYRIFPGQRLQLTGRVPVAATAAPKVAAKQPVKVTRKPPPKVVKQPVKVAKKSSNSARNKFDINWHWPVRGRVLARFQPNDPLRKGVDIAGKKGESVQAAADGTVIYAGSALRGYGKLLIIKHSEEFLSAYAHNDKLLVGEGTAVKAGQRIAELGSSGTDRDMLHFEIRRNGQPVDPMAYLP